MKSVTPKNKNVYYQGNYWNDLPEVREYMCKNLTGDKDKWWIADIQDRFCPKPFTFENALFLCDGNGWLSREFIDKKIVKHAVAFDWSTELLLEAEEKRGQRDIHYFQADVNTITFPDNTFDLIVNNAALHHVQFLNRLNLILSRALKPEGFFINFDYVGPRRNQYSLSHWKKIIAFNKKLPFEIRHEALHYPHLPTMLAADPTEAIHSDEIIKTMQRYFNLLEQHDTNGGLAYHLLTHNKKASSLQPSKRKPIVKAILVADRAMTAEKKVPVLFSYFIAQPKKIDSASELMIKKYQAYENIREKLSSLLLGSYSLFEFLTLVAFSLVRTIKIKKFVAKFL